MTSQQITKLSAAPIHVVDGVAAPASERYRIIVFSLVVWAISNFDQSLFGYAVPDILKEFGAELTAVGYILAVSFAIAAVLVSFAGMAADRYGRRVTLVTLLAVSAFFVGMQAFAHSLETLTVFRALAFGLSAGLAPVTAAYVAEAASARHRGMLIGALQCAYPLGWFLASLLAAPLLATQGWRALFMMGFAVIPLALLIGWKMPESRRFAAPASARSAAASPKSEGRGNVAELFGPQYRRTAITCAVVFFTYGCAYAGTAFFFPTFFTQARGYTPSQAAYLVGLSTGIGALGYLAAAFVGEYVTTRRNTLALWLLLGSLSLVALLWIPREPWQDKALFILTTSFFFGANGVIATLLTELFPTRIRTTAYAVCGSAPLSIGFAVYPMIVPFVVGAYGWQVALSFAIAPLLLIAAGAAMMLPNLRSGREVAE
ncbi:MAG TPA: MFS transporter [Steroidobacter sp.]|uniref:MFS transporter n=1 Tax=Steroidobacter sp. TaxID=1978227 RepID=UPI002EDAD261